MFPISKRHKYISKKNWRTRGVIFNNNFEEWYERYINSKECEKCNEPYKSSSDRCNIICQKCNKGSDVITHIDNKLGLKNIDKINCKSCKQGFRYRVVIRRNNIDLINNSSVDLQKIIKIRDTFILENPQYF